MAKLTAARRRGLEVLHARYPDPARESNVTSLEAGYVYWQTVRWLVDEGFAYYPSGSTMVGLTPKGLSLAVEEFEANER